jgi:hypothetical protein
MLLLPLLNIVVLNIVLVRRNSSDEQKYEDRKKATSNTPNQEEGVSRSPSVIVSHDGARPYVEKLAVSWTNFATPAAAARPEKEKKGGERER